MRRTFGTFFGIAGLLALGACKDTPKDPIKLVPDQATLIAGVNVKGLTDSKLYAEGQEQLRNGEAGKALEAARECELGPDKFKGVYLGADPGTENLAMVVNAEGIGKEKQLTCIHDKLKAADGASPWTVEERDGKKVLSMQGGAMLGYVVSDDILAITSPGWDDAVKALIGGKGKPAVDNSLKDLYSRAPKDKHVWFAGNLPPQAKAGLAGTPGEKVQDVVGSLDFSNGLAINVAAGVEGGAEQAKKLQQELQSQFDQFKGMGVVMGVPQGVVDSVKIGSESDSVTVQASISEAEMDAIGQSLKGMVGGAGGAPGVAAPPLPAPAGVEPGDMPPAEDPGAGDVAPPPGTPGADSAPAGAENPGAAAAPPVAPPAEAAPQGAPAAPADQPNPAH